MGVTDIDIPPKPCSDNCNKDDRILVIAAYLLQIIDKVWLNPNPCSTFQILSLENHATFSLRFIIMCYFSPKIPR